MKTRRFLGLFLFLLVSLFAFGFNASVKAEETSMDIVVQGAQVRTTGNAGLRFVAAENFMARDKSAFGFVLAFGEAKADENFVIGGTVNGKEVVSAEVSETDEGTFMVTLYDIPESMYKQKVSARAYVIADDEYVYAEEVCVRSLADVVIAAYEKGDESEFVKNVYELVQSSIDLTEYKMVFADEYNNFYVNSAVYETRPEYLAKEFIKDVNAFFSLELDYATAFEGNNGAQPLAKALADIKAGTDIAGTNVFKFFADETMRAKWGWLLQVVKYETDIDTAKWGNGKPAIDALLANNSSDGSKWYGGCYPVSSIMSILAGAYESTGYGGYNVGNNPQVLGAISKYNNQILADVTNAELVKIGDKITLPDAQTKDYYDWKCYTAGQEEYAANSEYVVTENDAQFIPTFTPTQYTVKFFDGETEITDLAFTYDIESAEKSLPSFEKDGFIFGGWYNNAEFTGSAVVSVDAGSHGVKVFYAKLTEISGYTITYNFNGGNSKYADIDAVITDLLADLTVYYGKGETVTKDNVHEVSEVNCPETGKFFMENATYSPKWKWLGDFMIATRAADSLKPYNLTTAGNAYWRYEVWGFVNKTFRSSWPNSSDYSAIETQMKYLPYLAAVESTEYVNQTGETQLLTNVYKEGYTFAGWYTSADFSGERVYSVTGATTLYAKWEAAQ